ncbi:MAG: hypothetical protein LBP56_02165 [Odoribacteraceae bacterium]|jgi:hypothetical protein|nr:hypothetical protein [Odoribacteraceae bacterium]
MKNKFFTLLIGGLGLFSVTCQRGEVATPGGDPSPEGFVIDYTVPPSRVTTYGTVPLEAGEDQINNLYVLFFQETSGGTGSFLGYYQVPTTDAQGNPAPLSSRGRVRVDFKNIQVTENPLAAQPVTFTPGGVYSLLLVANVDGFLDAGVSPLAWIAGMQGKSENAVSSACLLKVCGAADERDNGHTIQRDNLPMSARVKRASGQSAVSVELRRSVCRVDIRSSVSGYQLVSASIWNAYPTTPAWENLLTDYKSPRVPRLYGVTTTAPEIVGRLYAFENCTSASTRNDSVTTCVILGFTKNDTVYYYRANVNVTGLGQRLQRNNVYHLNVKGIHGAGEPCELDAYTSSKFLLDMTVNEWNLDDQGNVLSDGENVLAVPARNIVFTPAAESRSYAIYAAGPGTLELSRSHLPAGITAGLTGHTLTVTVTANEAEREGFIELRVENLKVVVSIKQTGKLDKYIELSRHDLPAFPGNGIFQMKGEVRVTSSGPWSARIYGEGFTFQFRGTAQESPVEVFHHASGESFTITSLGTNPFLDPRYAFVSVYLDEDPEVHQLLILAQDGKTSYEFYPALNFPADALVFNALGTRVGGRERYEVRVGGPGDGMWKVIVPDEHAQHFLVHYYDANGVYRPAATSLFGHGSFEIVALVNTTGNVINTQVKVVLSENPDSEQAIPVKQERFILSFKNTLVTAIAATGGSTSSPVIVSLSPEWTGATWTATVTASDGNTAYFGTTPGTSTASGNVSQGIVLSYGRLPFERARQGATTTVTVTAAGVTNTFTVPQAAAPWRVLTVKTYYDNEDGVLTPNGPTSTSKFDNFDYFYWAIHNLPEGSVRTAPTPGSLTLFGPGDAYTVQTNGHLLFSTNFTTTTGGTLDTNVDGIFTMNLSMRNYTSDIPALHAWLNKNIAPLHNAPANFMILIGDDYPDANQRREMVKAVLGVDCYQADYAGNSSSRDVATSPPAAGTPARKVWDYILRDGPFGPVNAANISIRSTDSYLARLDDTRPATTVPLLQRNNNGHVELAIDPVKRFLFIGNVEIFGTDQNILSEMNTDERNFMKNIIAFVINAAQYGEYFLADFK